MCGGIGEARTLEEEEGEHGICDDERNTMQGSGRQEDNGSGGMMMTEGGKEG